MDQVSTENTENEEDLLNDIEYRFEQYFNIGKMLIKGKDIGNANVALMKSADIAL